MRANTGSPGLRSVAPVFSTTDVARWLEHYRGAHLDPDDNLLRYGSRL